MICEEEKIYASPPVDSDHRGCGTTDTSRNGGWLKLSRTTVLGRKKSAVAAYEDDYALFDRWSSWSGCGRRSRAVKRLFFCVVGQGEGCAPVDGQPGGHRDRQCVSQPSDILPRYGSGRPAHFVEPT